MPDRWIVRPGAQPNLGRIDTASTAGAPGGKSTTEATLPEVGSQLEAWHDRLWAEGTRSLLVVLQAMDGGGKDGTIRHVFGHLAPQVTRVVAFKRPTELERSHDFLWRIHQQVPAHGEIVIFNRSHYEDVLVPRVKDGAPESLWRPRYDLVNAFEATLAHGGTTVLKFFLHISRDEQRRRFEDRLAEPDKRWKFRVGDLDDRLLWDRYQEAYEDVITATSTEHAPWYVIPADRKWYRNWAVGQVLLRTLEGMAPEYPEPPDLSGIAIR